MIDIRLIGDEIYVNGLKVAGMNPVKSLSISEIEEFKSTILDIKDNSRYTDDD